jgi:hypothetical protein
MRARIGMKVAEGGGKAGRRARVLGADVARRLLAKARSGVGARIGFNSACAAHHPQSSLPAPPRNEKQTNHRQIAGAGARSLYLPGPFQFSTNRRERLCSDPDGGDPIALAPADHTTTIITHTHSHQQTLNDGRKPRQSI